MGGGGIGTTRTGSIGATIRGGGMAHGRKERGGGGCKRVGGGRTRLPNTAIKKKKKALEHAMCPWNILCGILAPRKAMFLAMK